MTKTSRKNAFAAEESFHKHYAAIWGTERWDTSLYPALSEPTRYAALVNRYAPISEFWQSIDDAEISREELQQIHLPSTKSSDGVRDSNSILCFARGKQEIGEDGVPHVTYPSNSFPPPRPATKPPYKPMTHWNLDAASALVAHMLCVKPGDSVLDLCAAPGGKSVTLAQNMWPTWHPDDSHLHRAVLSGNIGELSSNEVDGKRQKRLAENLRAYLPPHIVQQSYAQCTNIDGTGTSFNALIARGRYDKVLVDAPCSSERHIIHAQNKAKASGHAAPEMANWRPGSSKRLAATQLQLLMMALKAAKLNGNVIYATCSIETLENDGVIEKMQQQVEKERKKGAKWNVKLGYSESNDNDTFEVDLQKWAEKTKYGWIILPDHPEGGRWGPLFFTILTKIASG